MDLPNEVAHTDDVDVPADSTSTERKLRIRFLDRFAELVSRDKGAEHVSCTMMRDTGAKVEIWVSRNTGVATADDERFFGDFERLMPNVKRSEEGMTAILRHIISYLILINTYK